jgi:hypothetical protein
MKWIVNSALMVRGKTYEKILDSFSIMRDSTYWM